MKHFATILFLTAATAALAVSPAKKPSSAAKQTAAKQTKPKQSKKAKPSSAGKYLNSVKPAQPKSAAPVILPKRKAEAHTTVFREVADAASIPIENPQGLIPFFEQLFRAELGQASGPVRILHYGDSHTAADDWTNTIRVEMQERFGAGAASAASPLAID